MKYKIYIIAAAAIAISFLLDGPVHFIANLINNKFLDLPMEWLTNFGSTFVVLILMAGLFMWRENKREWIPTIIGSYCVSIAAVFLFKLLFHRERLLGTGMYPFIAVLNYSFPSMHAAAAFAALPILDMEFPKLRWFWITFAVLVGISRIYFNMHYFSDVVVGALLGYGIGLFTIYIEKKTKIFKKVIKFAK